MLATIVVKEGETADDDDLRDTVKARLAGFKMPKLFERLSTLPWNATGKVTKDVLRVQFAGDQ